VQKSWRNSLTGVEKLSIKRKLGDKTRTLVRMRDGEGQEQSSETLENLEDCKFYND
jgi:hypothetical protein